MQFPSTPIKALTALALVLTASAAFAEGEVNIYSSRHYDTDERLYADFTAATGITINRIEGNADELIERMRAEGANSPADILITVDAGRIWRAEEAGLLSPVASEVLDTRIPAALRDPAGHWFGFSTRARVIFFDKDKVQNPPQTYAALADPAYKGMVCMRSATNIYSLSLLSAIIANDGEEAARAWAQGVKDNLAREPEGGDTDQLRGVLSGQCPIAISNTYYFARAIRTEVEGLTAADGFDRIGWTFPDQGGHGTHVNISGAGVAANAPNRDNAIAFLEYLASDQAQAYFADGNDEYPVVEGVALAASVAGLGSFTRDDLNLAELGRNQALAQTIYNDLGWK
ncbi:iron(III) transport system substrate-binding protein [Pseudorhodobacter antarcticus]|jgi:iron(III) transport system substrate-binding protein|uniref:Iron(III) transport system substrate-binding protein n=1 Tax=Pseudorhodobacter antarcticus TaxID=1077947 RepID=A0A1H8M814_9RHOB|nr:Fe(3+) ABC transporter substrate-binding protein [Pseudorhodobacter antarcticus]SEO13475.1 iron(III) transport system substrate-binding protein [Pseudorhodobacter antarcticus]